MDLFRVIKKYLLVSLVIILTFFLMGYFVTDFFVNDNVARYVYIFEYNGENVEELISVEYYDSVIKEIEEYNAINDKKISYAKIEYKEMLDKAYLEKDNEYYEISVLKKFFPTTVRESNGLVNLSENRCVKYLNLIYSYSNVNFIDFRLINYTNPFLVGGIAGGVAFILIAISILLLYFIKGIYISPIEDNQEVYTSIFHKSYWSKTMDFTKNVKSLCTVSILFSMMLICKLIPIPSGFGSLGIGFTYLFFSVISLIYGPICGIFIGFCSDILGYFLFQGGSIFFFGYTVSAMITGFIYGVFFYKKKITFTNCLLARFFVNIFINVVLGSIWWAIIYDLDIEAIKIYVLFTSLPKNVLYLLPQSILLFILFKMLAKPLSRFGLINDKIAQNVELF